MRVYKYNSSGSKLVHSLEMILEMLMLLLRGQPAELIREMFERLALPAAGGTVSLMHLLIPVQDQLPSLRL